MRHLKQFITYKPEWTGKKWNKLPLDPKTGTVTNALDRSIWVSYDEAVATGKPVAFVLTETDPYFCLDIDNCRLEDTSWSPEAVEVVNTFAGAFVEVSMSGNGLHIWGRYEPPIPDHACKNVAMGLELYHKERFIALGRPGATGDINMDCTSQLAAAIFQWFAPSIGGDGPKDWTTEPVAEWIGPEDDDELLERAIRSGGAASVFGNRASFKNLWEGDEEALSRAYPSQTGQPYDASSADMALATHLAFWTGKNCERIKSLMLKSELKRDKWDREAYIDLTVMRAVMRSKEVLSSKAEARETPVTLGGSPVSTEPWPPRFPKGFLSVSQQIELFSECTYISESNAIQAPDGEIYSRESFNNTLGGYKYPLTPDNGKVTGNAWEAFSMTEMFDTRKVRTECFRPDLPSNALVVSEGRQAVNTWWPATPKRLVGDPGPFLEHVKKLLPVRRDRDILLAYMAALVQHQGTKFPWAPFIQGAPGNGKTLLSHCLAYAIGDRYSYSPVAGELTSKFNSWLYKTIFIAVEDIYVPEQREDVWETLKPMITEVRRSIEKKGVDPVMRQVCGNFMINSNRKDGLRKLKDDRRLAPFFTAQQSVEDIIACGMGGFYFSNLYGWLRHQEGFAIVAGYLADYQIPDELNPAKLCTRAPDTSSTEEAVEHGRGRVEQEIIESVEQNVLGFCGGWVSSEALGALLVRIRADNLIPRNKRPGLLHELGYVRHPGLPRGRPTTTLADGTRPILYLKSGHWAETLVGAAIAKAFQDAQSSPVSSVPGVFGLPNAQ